MIKICGEKSSGKKLGMRPARVEVREGISAPHHERRQGCGNKFSRPDFSEKRANGLKLENKKRKSANSGCDRGRNYQT